jgi:PEP-CTERM motif
MEGIMNKNFLCKCAVVFAVLFGGVQATVIKFDDIGVPGGVYPIDYPDTGFQTQGFVFNDNMDVIDVGPNGWSTGVGSGHSGDFAALNDFSGPMVMTMVNGNSFSVQDLWLNGWQGDQEQSTISGYLNGNLIGSVIASYSNPWADFQLNFQDIDMLTITGDPDDFFFVDDISVSGVPEPSTLSMIFLGLFGLSSVLGLKRRKA